MSRVRHMAVVAVLLLAATAAGATAASPPSGKPPKVVGVRTPPPAAWVALPSAPARWLAYGSFCWKTACVDFLPPQMRPDVPRVRVAVGRTVRFHLAFGPSSLKLELVGSSSSWRLTRTRVSSWRVAVRGTFVLAAKGPSGSASYVFRIV